jgi:beta-galactosidase
MEPEELFMIRIRTILPISFFLLATFALAAAVPVNLSGERRISFNDGWKFFKGGAPGAEQPTFDDSAWRPQRLPHDWAIEGPFDSKKNPHTGALPIFGTGWYRKTFTLPANAKDRYFSIEFDGAMSNAHVWLNGKELGGRPYGYIGFSFDLTPQLRFGPQENVLAVRLTPEDHSSRWYPGAGIYRNVWMDITGPLHVARWGTYITTPEITDDKAFVVVKTEIRNQTGKDANVVVRTSLLDPSGRTSSVDAAPAVDVPAGGSKVTSTRIGVSSPQRWDIDHPYLYTAVSEILDAGKVVDRYTTPFGIRTIAYDKQKGFQLNGRTLKLHGVCDHHDLGALGTAVSRRATERQLEILKIAGVNAIRTSHNPPSPELLEYCDRMGLLVMDEAFDMWRIPKVPNGYSKYYDEWSERDVRDFMHRDRNHPSIIMWSIGNEVPDQTHADGWKEARRLTALFHEEDPTRPTTSAFNSWGEAIKNKLADEVDMPGFNYQPMHYEQIMKEHPNWIILGSETASCVSSRGVYHLPLERYQKHPSLQVSSYDIISPAWAYCPDVEFTYQDRFPNVLGEFVWTGFDYIGEPTPFFDYHPGADNSKDWPARSSYFGFIDLAGFPKDRYYLYQSAWTSKPMVHVLPHWNWAGHEGQTIPVMAYSNASEVELFLNGKSLGKKKRMAETWQMPVGPNVTASGKFDTKYRMVWEVLYAAGTLRAVGYQDGKQVAVDQVRTAGAPAKVTLAPDRSTINADGDDLSFVTVRIEDKDGNLVPGADNLVKFTVAGGTIAGVDNGNPASVESFQADTRKAFSGMALVIVRSQEGVAGKIKVTATSEGLAPATVEIATRSLR